MAYIGASPPATALTASDIADGIISEAKMADDAISLAELKAGTDGQIISWDASGNPVAIAVGTSGHFLKSAGAGAQPVFAEAGGGGLLQIKETQYKEQDTVSTTGYSVFNTNFGVTITPTASNSTFLLQANVMLSGSSHDVGGSLNFFDSQVGTGTTNNIFPDSTFSDSRTAGFATGWPTYSAASDIDHYAGLNCSLSGLYTPTSNNGNARTFYVCCHRFGNGGDQILNQAGNYDNASTGKMVSVIRVTEIANSVI